MKKKITFLLMFVLSLSMVSAQGTFRFGTSATPEGKTLLVDSKGLILDGKHIIPVMGEIHYSRVPESEWQPGNPQNEGRWYQYHFYIYLLDSP